MVFHCSKASSTKPKKKERKIEPPTFVTKKIYSNFMTLKTLNWLSFCIQKPITTLSTFVDHLMSVKELKDFGFKVGGKGRW